MNFNLENFNGKLRGIRELQKDKQKYQIEKYKFERVYHKWIEVREIVFNRDKFTCVKCGFKNYRLFTCYNKNIFINRQKSLDYFGGNPENLTLFRGRTKGLISDHIIPLALGGDEWNLNNLQTLCKKCNKKKTKQDMKDIWNFKKSLNNTPNLSPKFMISAKNT